MYIEMPYVFIPVKLTYIPPIYDKQHKHNFCDYTVKIYVYHDERKIRNVNGGSQSNCPRRGLSLGIFRRIAEEYENDQTYGYQYHKKDQTPDDYHGKTRTVEDIR